MRIPGIHRLSSALGLSPKGNAPAGEEKQFACPVCGSKVEHFDQLSYEYYLRFLDENLHIYPFFAYETLNIPAYSCPVCKAADRDRLYALYLQKKFAELDKSKTYDLVEFAPVASLAKFIRQYPFIRYRSADLFLPGVDDVVDLVDLHIYPDNSKDIFICSHILEHIYDDRKAMRELFRILKPGGLGIVMVPILLTLEETYENSAAQTKEERWKYFGQDDHVRIYAKKDFLSKLSDTGFTVHQYDINYFGADVFFQSGIHKRSVLYVVEKATGPVQK